MSAIRASRVLAATAILVAFALVLRSVVGIADGLDYFSDASGPIDALARGDLQQFAGTRALMGDFSLFLRAPFVWLVYDQSLTVVYLAGALPCLAALVALGVHLRRRMMALGRPAAAVLLVGLLVVLNPGTFRSLHWGHPEELLAGALCVGAIIAAAHGRSLLAGLLLGLALATKQWTLIAVIPTLLAASGQRLRLVLVAGTLAIVVALPALALSPQAVAGTQRSLVVQAQAVVSPPNVWWPLSSPRSAAERKAGAPGFAAKLPRWMGAIGKPLIVLAGVPLGWLSWRRRERLTAQDALALFALLMLLRCLLDPWNNDYYHAPFLLSLLAWEALARDGWPRMTLFASAALALTFPATLDSMSEMTADSLRYCVTYLAWALPLAGWLALTLFAPQALRRWSRALRALAPRPFTAQIARAR